MSNKLIRIFYQIILYGICIILCGIFFYPIIYVLSNSLRNLYSSPIIFFTQFDVKNYFLAVTMIPFSRFLVNSLILVIITLGLGVISNLIYGFAFARLNARGRNIMFTLVLSQLMIPSIALLIPQYVLFSNIGFKHTYWIWILGSIGGEAFFIFLYRQFFASIPKDYEDAARIDGCNLMDIIFRIFVPMSKSAIAVMVFFSFQNVWGEYMMPFMYLKEEQHPLAMVLINVGYDLPVKLGGRSVSIDPLIYAASVIIIIPVVIVFVSVQKYLVQGIVTTGIKG